MRPRRRGPKREKPVAAAPSTNAAPEAAEAPAENANHRENPAVEEVPRASAPNDLRARIEEAQEMWRARADVVRAQWKEKLNLDAAGAEKFDAAINEMNSQLRDTMQALADQVANSDKFTQELGLRLEATDGALALTAQLGSDEKNGARPLRRLLQRHVEDPAAELLLSGTLAEGERLLLDAEDGRLVLRRAAAAPALPCEMEKQA